MSARHKSLIIIGAGIAGLSTGCYAQMNGYRTQIFEAHNIPGGLCTSWKRRDYIIDGCMHHLAGSSPHSKLNRLWRELGALEPDDIIFHDELTRVQDAQGRTFVVYSNIDRLEQHMREAFPADAAAIDEYIHLVRRLVGLDMFDLLAGGPGEMIKAVPFAPALIRWGRVTLDQFAQKFSDPFLKRAFPTIQYDLPGIPMLVHLNFLVGCHRRNLGWPRGGGLAFARNIEERYRALGGEPHYRARVQEVLVENDAAVGVRLENGDEYRADRVISAADGYSTIYRMLGGRYVSERIERYYRAFPDEQEMNMHVSFGVARDMTGEPSALVYFLDEPVMLLGRPYDRISFEVYNFDPTLTPAGKTVVKTLLKTSYSHWKAASEDRERYEAEKQAVAETVLGVLERRFLGITGQVEMSDVSTPLTVERFTGNFHGFQPWSEPGASPLAMFGGGIRTLPGLRNFYLAGQWAQLMFGISTVAVSGRKLIETLCRHDGQKFVTSEG